MILPSRVCRVHRQCRIRWDSRRTPKSVGLRKIGQMGGIFAGIVGEDFHSVLNFMYIGRLLGEHLPAYNLTLRHPESKVGQQGNNDTADGPSLSSKILGGFHDTHNTIDPEEYYRSDNIYGKTASSQVLGVTPPPLYSGVNGIWKA